MSGINTIYFLVIFSAQSSILDYKFDSIELCTYRGEQIVSFLKSKNVLDLDRYSYECIKK